MDTLTNTWVCGQGHRAGCLGYAEEGQRFHLHRLHDSGLKLTAPGQDPAA
jgi:hypothetical protein